MSNTTTYTMIVERIIAWNAARYSREYNHELQVDLLYEELNELKMATEDVDTLDALADIFYVAIGAIWKLGKEPMECLHDNWYTQRMEETGYFNHPKYAGIYRDILTMIWQQYAVEIERANRANLLATIAYLAVKNMFSLGLSVKQAIDALLIVCDANDTKVVKKTAAHLKANVVKGENFIAPEPRLKELLRNVK